MVWFRLAREWPGDNRLLLSFQPQSSGAVCCQDGSRRCQTLLNQQRNAGSRASAKTTEPRPSRDGKWLRQDHGCPGPHFQNAFMQAAMQRNLISCPEWRVGTFKVRKELEPRLLNAPNLRFRLNLPKSAFPDQFAAQSCLYYCSSVQTEDCYCDTSPASSLFMPKASIWNIECI